MSVIAKTIPTNLQEEKAKFWADPTYNPQFVYAEQVDDDTLGKYGQPLPQYLEIAQAILDKTYFHRNEADVIMTEGPVVDQAEVTEKIAAFLTLHNLQHRFEIIWSSSFLARAAMTASAIKLRLPAEFRYEGMMGMIFHEVGTHAIRRINYEQQPWFKKKTTYGFSEYLVTEEGLAVLHALIPHRMKSLYIGAIRYLAVNWGQQYSFAETWQRLGPYVQDPERRWLIAYRAKRGMTDTSQPGGFTKDLTYLQGPIEVWQWLRAHTYDLQPLYFGKLAYQDVDKAVAMNPTFQPLLPLFYTSDREGYVRELEAIGEFNLLNQLASDDKTK